jgi:kinesin family member 3B
VFGVFSLISHSLCACCNSDVPFQAMEEKLIKGGEVISKAAKQEAALRQAEKELRERQMQEAALARELAEKEEANLQLEEHFSSLQEEVEVKTKKLKKLWNKFQGATREVKDLQEEFAVSKKSIKFILEF